MFLRKTKPTQAAVLSVRRTFQSSLSTEEEAHPHDVGTDVIKKPLENQQEEPFQEYSHTEVLF